MNTSAATPTSPTVAAPKAVAAPSSCAWSERETDAGRLCQARAAGYPAPNWDVARATVAAYCKSEPKVTTEAFDYGYHPVLFADFRRCFSGSKRFKPHNENAQPIATLTVSVSQRTDGSWAISGESLASPCIVAPRLLICID